MDNGYCYTVYGLTLRSNRPLPGLVPAGANIPVDVWIDLRGEETSRPPPTEAEELWCGSGMLSKTDGDYFHLWFRSDKGRLDFEINPEGTHIAVDWTFSDFDEAIALLLGPALGYVLRLRGVLCLHACAIKIDNYAIAVMGDSGGGKSTLGAALARQGYPILSDDIAVLNYRDQQWQVFPGYPRLRLWPEAIKVLYGSEDGLARTFSFSEKRFVDLTESADEVAWRFQSQPLPLAALYVLGGRKIGLPAQVIEPIRPAMAIVALMVHRTVKDYLQLASGKQAWEFAGLSRVAMDVPTRRVICSNNLDALPQLCDAIVGDLAVLTC